MLWTILFLPLHLREVRGGLRAGAVLLIGSVSVDLLRPWGVQVSVPQDTPGRKPDPGLATTKGFFRLAFL